MSTEKVHLIARFTALPGKHDALLEVLSTLIGPTRAEEGCIRYDLLQNHFDPCEFTFVEIWESRAHLDVHIRSSYLQDMAMKLEGLMKGSADIRIFRQVG